MAMTVDAAEDVVLRWLQASRARARRGVTAGEIAAATGVPPQSVREALVELARRGLLERDVDHDHRRIAVLWSCRRPAEDELGRAAE